MLKSIKSLIVALVATSGSVALADDCRISSQLQQQARQLETKTEEVDELWDELADDSRASDVAEQLEDAAMDFREDLGDDDCASVKAEFAGIQQLIVTLKLAVRRDPVLRGRPDVLGAIQEVETLANRLGRLIQRL